MARSRQSTFRRTSVSSRRLTGWNEGPGSSVLQSSVAVGSILGGLGQEALQRLTLVRIRGEFAAWIRLATSVGDGFENFDAGIGITTAEAFAAGQASIPTAGSDKDWPGWLWHHSGASVVSLSTTEVARGPIGAFRIEIDSKAMRHFRLNEVMFFTLQMGTEIGTAQLDWFVNTRILTKLA